MAALSIMAAFLIATPTPQPATAAELSEMALAYLKMGQPTRGLDKINEALALDPRHYRANFIPAVYFVQTKQYDRAAPYLKTALAAKQDDPELLFTIGVLCQGQQRLIDAEGWYQRARRLAPQDPKIVYNLGMLHVLATDYPKAKTYLEKYLQLAPQASDRAYVKDKIRELSERIGAKHG